MKASPFADKLDYARPLFTRVHGVAPQDILAGETATFEFIVPYAHAKITCVEVVEVSGSRIDFTVEHPQAGLLSQFGFNVNNGERIYKRESSYDADLYLGLILKVVVKNDSQSTKRFGVNLVLHEVRE